jgi:murein L,D-transpeptidase YcbB/YkuD
VVRSQLDLETTARGSGKILRDALTGLYAQRVYAPLWFSAGELTPPARQLRDEFQHAAQRGLRPSDYPFREPLSQESVLAADVRMSLAVARFVLDLHAGRIDPREVGLELDVSQARLDVPLMLVALASTPHIAAALDQYEPPFRHYRLLKASLAQYRMLADAQTPSSPMLDARVRSIELTLERIRWLPPKLDSPPIIVNIPQFKLFAFRTTDDFVRDILQMDVIVGAVFEERQTPVFAADMRFVVLHPYWDVPASIMRRELLPLIRARPRWVEDNGYEIVQGQTDAAKVMPVTAESIERLAAGALRLRQKPGRENALGVVKFMLPNRHNVYLHDTPTHALFRKTRRAFSHGCIRVSNPKALLMHVLRDDPSWTPERITAALDGDETQRIPLRKPIRMFIVYGTALATEAGETLFFEDIYHHDARLLAALDARSRRIARE